MKLRECGEKRLGLPGVIPEPCLTAIGQELSVAVVNGKGIAQIGIAPLNQRIHTAAAEKCGGYLGHLGSPHTLLKQNAAQCGIHPGRFRTEHQNQRREGRLTVPQGPAGVANTEHGAFRRCALITEQLILLDGIEHVRPGGGIVRGQTLKIGNLEGHIPAGFQGEFQFQRVDQGSQAAFHKITS